MSLRVDIQKQFGAFQLDVQLRAKVGTTALFGPSGSGKTTLINAIAGLHAPTTGHISLDETVLFDAKRGVNLAVHQRRIGYVFQDARLFPHLNVRGNLEFASRFAKHPISPALREELIEVLGIGSLLERRPAALSGGETQRVALGRALLSAPRLILLDEPLAALDGARKQEILPYFERLRARGGPAMIYVTHDMSEIVRLADSVVILKEGRCATQGRVEDVLADPANVKHVGVQDAGVLICGTIDGHADDGLSAIRLSAGLLHLPQIKLGVGTRVRLRIRAQDVILATARPEGLSSQNLLEAQITEVRKGEGPGVIVAMRSGSDRLLSRITARALSQLDLRVGQKVWAVIKANAVPPSAISMAGSRNETE